MARSTLADANETRDRRIVAGFAQGLIARAKPLYAGDPLGVDLQATVYAFDSTTIDLCLALFPWARFRQHKGAITFHALLDLRGDIPEAVYISDGKLADVRALDVLVPLPGAYYVLVAILKKRLALPQSLYTILQVLSGTLFENVPIHQALALLPDTITEGKGCNQLLLCDR